MPNLTYDELHIQLMYNPWTGDFYWKNPSNNNVKIGGVAGTLTKKGYIYIGINNKQYMAHRLAWFYVYGYMPENMIDHESRIKTHNCIKNLREASDQCSNRNRGMFRNNTTEVTGVYKDKSTNRWISQITVNKKRKHLGRYKDFDDAVCARLAGEQCLNWEDCDSNSSAFKYVKENIQWWI